MTVPKVKKRLEQVVDEAQTRLDVEIAQNPELRRAIHIVEAFLQKTGRVCYGGQAINAQLPQKDHFYNPETSLPDYDFFSPNAKEDVDGLVDSFQNAGYTEISKRIGMHDGTIKIYVNYTAIADISQVIPDFYDAIFEKSRVVNGIHYADPIFLRMMMYLELSRPRGEVARWEKVYQRLKLLDAAHPLAKCKKSANLTESKAAEKARPTIVRYMIKHKRVFMGADIRKMYTPGGTPASRTKFLLHGSTPVVFFSPNADLDADVIKGVIMARKVPITGYQGILPAMVALYHEDTILCIIVQEEACHSIVSLPLTKQRYLRLASPDTLLTFLIGLYYRPDPLLMTQESLLCWLKEYIDISNRYKTKPTKLIPAFSIECSGYQTTFASLLREKGARIEAARQQIRSGEKVVPRTRRKFFNLGSRMTRRRAN
jgi:hypothetical protein